jgi:hypothetical protein
MGIKYFRFKRLGFLLFESTKIHADIAALTGDEIVSAGEVDMDELNPPMCHGQSYTLNVASKKEDTKLLRRYLTR